MRTALARVTRPRPQRHLLRGAEQRPCLVPQQILRPVPLVAISVLIISLVEVFLTFAIFFTPVFYDVDLFGRWAKLLLINPVAPILEAMDAVIVDHQPPDLAWMAYSAVATLLILILAYSFFKRSEPMFAESI